MVTRNHTPVGASNSNPNTATPAGQEVTSPGTTIPVTAPPANLPPTAEQLLAVVAAAKAFREGYSSLRSNLLAALSIFPAPDKARTVATSSQRRAATPVLAYVLRQYPVIAPHVSPDVIDAGMAAGDALRMVAADAQTTLPTVNAVARVVTADAWLEASKVYRLGNALATSDRDIDAVLAPVRVTLQKGKRTVTSPANATKAAAKAANAQQRALTAQARASKAHRATVRVLGAHADNHPTVATTADSASPPSVYQGPTVNPQGPAPIPASVYQGPAVNPQGPAPGRLGPRQKLSVTARCPRAVTGTLRTARRDRQHP